MKKVTMFLLVLAGVVFWAVHDEPTMSTPAGAAECPDFDRFMQDRPDAMPEEMLAVEECNRDRLVQTGRDKRSTGFLGNRNIRPEGALAHYEGGSGALVFTLYRDLIAGKDLGDELDIRLSAIKSVEKSGHALVIDYEDSNGRLKRYGVSLFGGGDDPFKSEGNTDLDRLVDLINELRVDAG